MFPLDTKHRRRASLVLAVCLSLTVNAAAAEGPGRPVLSANVTAAAGTVPSASDMDAAAEALAAFEAQEAVRRAEEAAEESARAAEEAARQAAYDARAAALLQELPEERTVMYDAQEHADEVVCSLGTPLGEFKLTFYCPCIRCCGNTHGKTFIGTKAVEGRTIAVDPKVIPLGSRVYIEGYGVFIAEDTGGAIKSNKIDVFLVSHSRAWDNGVARARVYLL